MDQQKCRFYNSSTGCSRGNSCRFLHETSEPNDKIQLCRFFQTSNGCRNGNSCPYEHRAIGAEIVPSKSIKQPYEMVGTRHLVGPFYGIDVECVATGKSHLDRAVARIALVDENENVVFDRYVKPDVPVISCLTPLTGIEQYHLDNAANLTHVMGELITVLPKQSIIIGQSVSKDIEWVGLEKDVHYSDSFDVANLFRMFNGVKAKRKYRYFSLRQIVKYLIGEDIQMDDHDPIIDAKYAMRVFHQYRYLHESLARLQAVHQSLSKTPRLPSFAERMPYIDGVALAANSAVFAQSIRESTGTDY